LDKSASGREVVELFTPDHPMPASSFAQDFFTSRWNMIDLGEEAGCGIREQSNLRIEFAGGYRFPIDIAVPGQGEPSHSEF
jgi:hypothetical protein